METFSAINHNQRVVWVCRKHVTPYWPNKQLFVYCNTHPDKGSLFATCLWLFFFNFIYIVLYTIQIVSKQLYSIKQENSVSIVQEENSKHYLIFMLHPVQFTWNSCFILEL